MSGVARFGIDGCNANWFYHCFRGLFVGPSKRRRHRGSKNRRQSRSRTKTLRSAELSSALIGCQVEFEVKEPLPERLGDIQAQSDVGEAQPEEIGMKTSDAPSTTPALPETSLAGGRALVPQGSESIPPPLTPRAAALRDLVPAAGIEASPALVALLMARVRHTGPPPRQRQITSGVGGQPQGVAYQVQVSAPIETGDGPASGPSEATSLAVNASIRPTGPASVPLLDEALAATDAAVSSQRIYVPWALFPYLFDLVPAIDGVPCDGLMMLGKLVAVMSSSGFRLKAASKCPDNDACTMLELHGGIGEKEWKVLQDSMWAWGIVVMNTRVPLELSPNRSMILQMFD